MARWNHLLTEESIEERVWETLRLKKAIRGHSRISRQNGSASLSC
jgi:hypothetical protein